MPSHDSATPTPPAINNLVPSSPDVPFGADANDSQRAQNLSPRQQALADFAEKSGADVNQVLAQAGQGRNLTPEELARKRGKENFFTGVLNGDNPISAVWNGLMWSEHNIKRPISGLYFGHYSRMLNNAGQSNPFVQGSPFGEASHERVELS